MTDQYNRIHDYLRISLTDKCNFRCAYCMPDENMQFWPQERLMQRDEILAMAEIFVGLGVRKIRLTGGEPTVRKDFADILLGLSRLPVELTLTSNGVLIDQLIGTLKEAGVRSLNISLDTLDPAKFQVLTRRDMFNKVWSNIRLLIREGFHVKMNAVLMRGINDMEIPDFVELTRDLPLHVRFIEFMPFVENHWTENKVVSYQEIMEWILPRFDVEKLSDDIHDTAKKYKVTGYAGTFAVISTVTEPFCAGCNRMRLTADGKMKNCLFATGETDLLGALRRGENIQELIRQNVWEKKPMRGKFEEDHFLHERSMILIGG